MDFRTKKKGFSEGPISRHLILELLSDYDRPNDKISELIKTMSSYQLERAVYNRAKNESIITGTFYNSKSPKEPSYISLKAVQSCRKLFLYRIYGTSENTGRSTPPSPDKIELP